MSTPPLNPDLRALPVTLVLCATVLVLPLMMGQRTPMTLTASLATLVSLAALAALLAARTGSGALPRRAWMVWAGVLTGLVIVQVWPAFWLATAFGPYPDDILAHPATRPLSWSPDIGASMRGWATFVALFTIAWLAHGMRPRQRYIVWLAVVLMAVFQALYGLLSHATGSETIFGIWERNNPAFVHGSFSNRNLFAGYMALTWPLAVCIWFIRDLPVIGRWPKEIRVAAAVISGAVIGAAMLGSASRLGSAAGVFSILMALLLLGQHRNVLHGASVWPAWGAALAALVAATWYGLTPLAERLLATTGEETRMEVITLMLAEFPRAWWLHGVGLGGFEAAFKQFQPGHIGGWFDYAHNDLLQWWVETGVIGLGLMAVVLVALARRFRLTTERIALYSGLAALGIIALGDFSWHLPATQVVLALFIGVLLAPARSGMRRESGSRRRKKRTSGD